MGELDEENLHLGLSIDVSLKRVVSTIFGYTDGYVLSWAKDTISSLYSTCAYCIYIKFTFGKLHFKNISDKL